QFSPRTDGLASPTARSSSSSTRANISYTLVDSMHSAKIMWSWAKRDPLAGHFGWSWPTGCEVYSRRTFLATAEPSRTYARSTGPSEYAPPVSRNRAAQTSSSSALMADECRSKTSTAPSPNWFCISRNTVVLRSVVRGRGTGRRVRRAGFPVLQSHHAGVEAAHLVDEVGLHAQVRRHRPRRFEQAQVLLVGQVVHAVGHERRRVVHPGGVQRRRRRVRGDVGRAGVQCGLRRLPPPHPQLFDREQGLVVQVLVQQRR